MNENEQDEMYIKVLDKFKTLNMDTQAELSSLLEDTIESAKVRGDCGQMVEAYTEVLDRINEYRNVNK